MKQQMFYFFGAHPRIISERALFELPFDFHWTLFQLIFVLFAFIIPTWINYLSCWKPYRLFKVYDAICKLSRFSMIAKVKLGLRAIYFASRKHCEIPSAASISFINCSKLTFLSSLSDEGRSSKTSPAVNLIILLTRLRTRKQISFSEFEGAGDFWKSRHARYRQAIISW